VVDGGNSRVEEFSSSGSYLSQFGAACGHSCANGQFSGAGGIAIDGSGNLWVEDATRIQEFNTSGSYLSQLAIVGSSVSIDKSNNLWVTNFTTKNVQEYNSSGSLLLTFGGNGTGNGQFNYPVRSGFDSTGNIWATDNNNQRVQEFNSSGSWLFSFPCTGAACSSGSGNGQFNLPSGIAFDASGNIWVVDNQNARVQKFNSSGSYLSQFGSAGSGNGQFSAPNGMAIH
jgi:DNA-binding beta-propeller fold protein YncE